MDRLMKLADNDDKVKSGQNNRRVARIRQYDDEIARLREMVREVSDAKLVLETSEIGSFIRRDLTNRCLRHLTTAHEELARLENERAMLARGVQR